MTLKRSFRVVGLFAGIGGIERGLQQAGHKSLMLCENDPHARAILKSRFHDCTLKNDIHDLAKIPRSELLAAGFPCQDLSQVGTTKGISGSRSSLVSEVFRIIADCKRPPEWVLLENVPFMLQLQGGRAMKHITSRLTGLGYSWAYRIVDTQSFGLPQRRKRVIILAAKNEDPRDVLLVDDFPEPVPSAPKGAWRGFFWTEGNRGIGWAINSVPTLKGGSGLGIASPPAIWIPGDSIVIPDVRDGERLQGFPARWTEPIRPLTHRVGPRWKLVGNAVTVPVAKWVGQRLAEPGSFKGEGVRLKAGERWPASAWCIDGRVFRASVTDRPAGRPLKPIDEFLLYPPTPLSARATRGFLSRAKASSLYLPPGFLGDLDRHLSRMRKSAA